MPGGSRLDADHPSDGVLIPRRSTDIGTCAPMVAYSREFQTWAAEELALLPEVSAVAEMLSDYALMREPSLLLWRYGHNQTVHGTCHDDLTGKSALDLSWRDRGLEHFVLYRPVRAGHALITDLYENMAGRAHQRPATFSHNARNAMASRCFHEAMPLYGLNRVTCPIGCDECNHRHGSPHSQLA